MKGSLLLYNLKLNCLVFSTGLNGSLIIFIRTYTVNYRNPSDRLRVRINIILFPILSDRLKKRAVIGAKLHWPGLVVVRCQVCADKLELRRRRRRRSPDRCRCCRVDAAECGHVHRYTRPPYAAPGSAAVPIYSTLCFTVIHWVLLIFCSG